MHVRNSALVALAALLALGSALAPVHASPDRASHRRRAASLAKVRREHAAHRAHGASAVRADRHQALLAKLRQEDELLYQLRHERNAYAHRIAHLAALVTQRKSRRGSAHEVHLAKLHAEADAAKQARIARSDHERRLAARGAHRQTAKARMAAQHADASSGHAQRLAALRHIAALHHIQRLAQIRAHENNLHAARLRRLAEIEAERQKHADYASRAVHIATSSGLPIWQGDAYAAQVPVKVVTVDLNDPRIKVSALLARNGIGTSEPFTHMIDRTHPYVAVTGTFFSLDNLRPVGDIVINGSLAYFGGMGTALAIRPDNHADMITVPWGHHHNWTGYQTVIACGPRLLEDGQIVLDPRMEHFRDQHMLAPNSRIAVGITGHNQLVFCMTRDPIYLGRLAKIMRSLGCKQAMNLDAGTSTGFYCDGRLMARPGRWLTNAIVVYDNSRDRHAPTVQSASASISDGTARTATQTASPPRLRLVSRTTPR